MTEEFDNLLREHNLSLTSARKAVLWAVASFPHSDAENILKHARKKSGSLSKQAVYDNLRVLTEKGIVRTIQPMGHSALFEIDHKDNHHHIVCRCCGVTMDTGCKQGAKPCLSPADARGFIVDEAEVIFWGTCPACQTANPKKRKTRS